MKLTQKEIQDTLYALARQTNGADPDRGLVMVAAVSKAVAYALPLPSSPVVSLRSYYADNAEQFALAVLSDVNEHAVFNLRQAKEMVFQIYRARYHVVHMPHAVDLHRLTDAVVMCDERRSLEPKFAGIFERISGGDKSDADQVSWAMTELLTRTTEAAFDGEGAPIEQA